MPRAGLTTTLVTEAAASLVAREGISALTLARIAKELGVKPPSLYSHVEGLDGLVREVALDGIDRLADACRSAVMGRSDTDALRAMASAYRGWATTHPGVYPLTQVARPDDAEYEALAARFLEAVTALLSSFGLPDDQLIHAARAIRSSLHGFVLLETQSGFGLDVDVDESFDWMLLAMEGGLKGESLADLGS